MLLLLAQIVCGIIKQSAFDIKEFQFIDPEKSAIWQIWAKSRSL
jgi:hypothetical protein